jgi:hypothetical protein
MIYESLNKTIIKKQEWGDNKSEPYLKYIFVDLDIFEL